MKRVRFVKAMRLIRYSGIGLLSLLIISIINNGLLAADGPIYVNGKKLDCTFRFKKGVKYLPVELTCSALGLKASQEQDTWLFQNTYRGDLKVSARKFGFIERDKIVFAPTSFWTRELGLEIIELNNSIFVLNKIVEIRKESDGLLITTAAPLSVKSLRLDNPSRDVYDIENLSIGSDKPELRYEFVNKPFSSIRIGQFSCLPHIARLVVDHDYNKSYRPIQSLHGPANNILWVGQNPYIGKSLTLFEDEEEVQLPSSANPSIRIEPDGSVIFSGIAFTDPSIEYLWNETPSKVVCHLKNCVLPSGKEEIYKGEGKVKRVILKPNEHSKNRDAMLIIELTEAVPMSIAESKGDYIRISPNTMNFKKPFKILIDPGHGGAKIGTQALASKMGGLSADEKDVNLRLAKILGSIFEKIPGVQVFYTRTTDVHVELEARRLMAHQLGVDLFISIHCNSTEQQPTYYLSGHEIYFNNPKDKKLAETVWRSMGQQTGNPGRGYFVGNYHVIMRNPMPSILVETAFFNNPNDLAKLLSPTSGFCEASMLGVAIGVAEYFNLPFNPNAVQTSMLVGDAGQSSVQVQGNKSVKSELTDKIGKLVLDDENVFQVSSRKENGSSSRSSKLPKKIDQLKNSAQPKPQIFTPPDKKKKNQGERVLIEDTSEDEETQNSVKKSDKNSEKMEGDKEKSKENVSEQEKTNNESEADKNKSDEKDKGRKKESKRKKRNIFKVE